MAIDLQADARRLRASILVGSLLVLATLAAAGVQAGRPGWKKHQADFRALGAVPADRSLGIVQAETCTDQVDRCATCHLGAERRDLAGQGVAAPLGAHPFPLDAHASRSVGCADCHGGSARALDAAVAHAFPGDAARDPMMREPHIQASCVRCHVPGDVQGMERLVHGSRVFAEWGCGICHPLSGGGRGGWDFGPDLRAGGRKSVAYLETSLTEPAANFPESTMPSFATVAKADEAAFTDLVIFLQSLELSRASTCSLRERSARLAAMPCASCHAGPAGQASGRLQHRCLYLAERKDQLACAGCHPQAIPAAGAGAGVCPVEREHRGACAACHDDFPGGAR